MANYEFNLVPRDVGKVKSDYRIINTDLPAPDSLPLLQELKNIESRSMHGAYPMIWKSAGVAFLEHTQTSQGRTQDVQILDAAGTAHYVRYFLMQTPNGWKISGVQFLDVTDISV